MCLGVTAFPVRLGRNARGSMRRTRPRGHRKCDAVYRQRQDHRDHSKEPNETHVPRIPLWRRSDGSSKSWPAPPRCGETVLNARSLPVPRPESLASPGMYVLTRYAVRRSTRPPQQGAGASGRRDRPLAHRMPLRAAGGGRIDPHDRVEGRHRPVRAEGRHRAALDASERPTTGEKMHLCCSSAAADAASGRYWR